MNIDDEKFDGLLLAIAEKHENGIPQVWHEMYFSIYTNILCFQFLDTIASFLRRKTDFFTGVSQAEWEGLLLGVFQKQYEKAITQNSGNGNQSVTKQDNRKAENIAKRESRYRN